MSISEFLMDTNPLFLIHPTTDLFYWVRILQKKAICMETLSFSAVTPDTYMNAKEITRALKPSAFPLLRVT